MPRPRVFQQLQRIPLSLSKYVLQIRFLVFLRAASSSFGGSGSPHANQPTRQNFIQTNAQRKPNETLSHEKPISYLRRLRNSPQEHCCQTDINLGDRLLTTTATWRLGLHVPAVVCQEWSRDARQEERQICHTLPERRSRDSTGESSNTKD